MKSKRAEKLINNRSELIDGLEWMGDASTARRAVELAEQDAKEEVTHYRKELEESKRREELACKVIDDQRKKIEALKAGAADAFKEYMEQAHGGYLTSDLDNFLQKLNER